MKQCSKTKEIDIESICQIKAEIAFDKESERRKKNYAYNRKWKAKQKMLAGVHKAKLDDERVKMSCPTKIKMGALVDYVPHEKQRLFHESLAKSRWLIGGNRTGKTTGGAVEAIRMALESETHGWVISVSLQVQRDVAQKKVLEYLPQQCIQEIVMNKGRKQSFGQHGAIDYIVVKNKVGTTSKIGFKSCEQSREKFQGVSLDWVWFDEEPPEDIYEEALLRTLDKGGKVWGTMTPLKGRTWLYDRIYLKQDEHFVLQMSWSDNSSLDESEIESMRRALGDEALQSREHGRFMEMGGVVFRELSEDNVIDPIDLDDSYDTYIGIDPGYRSPTGAVWVRTDGRNYYVVSDYSVSEKFIEVHAKAILDISGADRVSAYIDFAALQRHLVAGDETVASRFREHGVDVFPQNNKSVNAGIHLIKGMLRDGQLKIFRTCENLLKEMRKLSWGKGETPVKRDDHCVDALRYVLMALQRVRAEVGQGRMNEHKRRLLS